MFSVRRNKYIKGLRVSPWWMLGALRHRIRTNNAWIECEGKGVCEKNGAGVFQTEEHPSPRAMLNDNTTQMSVPIVGNKSLSSYDCATKLGPSDSLITSLSWVCLGCLNGCLLGPNHPPPPPLLPGKQKATTALRRLWIRHSMSPHLHRPTERANPAGRPSPRPVPSTPQCSGPVSHCLIPHSDPLRRTSSALRRVKQLEGDQWQAAVIISAPSVAHSTLAERWRCGGSSRIFWKRRGRPCPAPSPRPSSGKHSTGSLAPRGRT